MGLKTETHSAHCGMGMVSKKGMPVFLNFETLRSFLSVWAVRFLRPIQISLTLLNVEVKIGSKADHPADPKAEHSN